MLLPFISALAGYTTVFHRGPMPGEPAGAAFEEVCGARVRYIDEGEGPPVVLLHGFASSIEAWDPVRPALRARRRVIGIDLKGFGWTDRPPGDYSPRAQAHLVLAMLERRGVEGPVAVVAHSWGASIALELALLAPKRVSRLALYAAWAYEEQLPSFFVWAREGVIGGALFAAYYKEHCEHKLALAFYDRRHVTRALVDSVERALERPGTVAAALAAVRGQRYGQVQGRYSHIRQPALLLWGRADAVTQLSFGERLARDLPRADLRAYPACGHFPMIEAAEASTRDLVAFLDEPAP